MTDCKHKRWNGYNVGGIKCYDCQETWNVHNLIRDHAALKKACKEMEIIVDRQATCPFDMDKGVKGTCSVSGYAFCDKDRIECWAEYLRGEK